MIYRMKFDKYIINIYFIILIFFLNIQIPLCNEFQARIVAKVNGSPITSFDIEERLNIFLNQANLEKNDINREKFAKDVLNSLIEEEIKIQEAIKIYPNIYGRAELQAEKLIEINFGPGIENINKNLKSYDVSIQHIKRFFTADVLWTSLIKARHEREFGKVDEKVQKKIKSLNLDLMKNHYKLSEIKISANNNQDIKETEKYVEEIIQKINLGENFYSLAKQFSSVESKIYN